jgi:ADP-ribose pyrophosphatase
MIDPGETVSATLKREFGEEALNTIEKNPTAREIIEKQLNELFAHGVEIYKGYVDDPRNTDNAWYCSLSLLALSSLCVIQSHILPNSEKERCVIILFRGRMETVAVNFHDEDGKTFSKFTLQAGDDAGAVKWMTLDSDLVLYASHIQFLKVVAEKRGAYF